MGILIALCSPSVTSCAIPFMAGSGLGTNPKVMPEIMRRANEIGHVPVT